MIINKPVLFAVAKEKNKREDICDVIRSKASICDILVKKKIKTDILFVEKTDFKNVPEFKRKILRKNPHCIFNLFEGFSSDPFKEAEFAKIIENLGVPLTGNSSSTLGTCLDKLKTKNILKKNGIPVPAGVTIKNINELDIANLNFPVFVKPRCEDASVGINENSLCWGRWRLLNVLKKRLKEFPGGLLIEDFLPGQEYSVAFLGNFPYKILGLSVINYSAYKKLPSFLTYASKWDRASDEFKKIKPCCGMKMDKKLIKRIIDKASLAAKMLGCKSYFRVDLRAKEDSIFVIDINPNPDINTDSGYIKQASRSGYAYAEIIEEIIKSANTLGSF